MNFIMPGKAALLSASVFILLMSASALAAEAYYADVVIDVEDNGYVSITGYSDNPDLQSRTTQMYTTKDRDYWILNISPEGIFSEYVAEIRFPPNAAINYINVPRLISVSEESGRIVVTMTGTNQTFYIVAQYSVLPTGQADVNYYIIISFAMLLLAALLGYYAFSRSRRRGPEPGFAYNPHAFTDRQSKIVEAIKSGGGHMTQSTLQKKTGLPKASLSRNIDALIRKGVLVKEEKGMTNLLSLKKPAQ